MAGGYHCEHELDQLPFGGSRVVVFQIAREVVAETAAIEAGVPGISDFLM